MEVQYRNNLTTGLTWKCNTEIFKGRVLHENIIRLKIKNIWFIHTGFTKYYRKKNP
jgi:hypothetical protein